MCILLSWIVLCGIWDRGTLGLVNLLYRPVTSENTVHIQIYKQSKYSWIHSIKACKQYDKAVYHSYVLFSSKFAKLDQRGIDN